MFEQLLEFMGNHPVLAFFLIYAAYHFCTSPFRLANRALRSINIALRGWPPGHLDADGDWKPEESE